MSAGIILDHIHSQLFVMNTAESASATVLPAPRNYERAHLSKLTYSELITLEANLQAMLFDQSGINAETTQVCINRTNNAMYRLMTAPV